jgi:hypothetical protein
MNIKDEIKQGEGYVLLSRAAVESCSKTTLETRLVNSMVNSQFGKDKSEKKIQNDTNMSHQRSEIIRADEGPCVSQFIFEKGCSNSYTNLEQSPLILVWLQKWNAGSNSRREFPGPTY